MATPSRTPQHRPACGDAQTLPYADATFSLFGLMIFPDRQRGFAEIHRTLKPGGSIAVTTLENPERFMQEMEEAGFRNIEIRKVTKAFPVGSTGEFWESMVKGSAPIKMMKKGLDEELWREKEKLALAWLEETLPRLKGPLTSDAWLGVGVK